MTMRGALSRFDLLWFARALRRRPRARALPSGVRPSPSRLDAAVRSDAFVRVDAPGQTERPQRMAGGGLSALLIGAALLVGGPLAGAAALGGAVLLARRGAHPRTRATTPKPATAPATTSAARPIALDDPDARPTIFDDGWDVVPAPI